jgi:hypothetical protein
MSLSLPSLSFIFKVALSMLAVGFVMKAFPQLRQATGNVINV